MVRRGSVEPSSRGDATSISCASPTAPHAAMRRSPAVMVAGAVTGATTWPGRLGPCEHNLATAVETMATSRRPAFSRRASACAVSIVRVAAIPSSTTWWNRFRASQGSPFSIKVSVSQGCDGVGLVVADPRVRREREPRLAGTGGDGHPVEEADAREPGLDPENFAAGGQGPALGGLVRFVSLEEASRSKGARHSKSRG